MSAHLEWTTAKRTTFALRRPGQRANDGQRSAAADAWHVELGADEDGMVIEGTLDELRTLLLRMLAGVDKAAGRIPLRVPD